jgi:hypothetical protein
VNCTGTTASWVSWPWVDGVQRRVVVPSGPCAVRAVTGFDRCYSHLSSKQRAEHRARRRAREDQELRARLARQRERIVGEMPDRRLVAASRLLDLVDSLIATPPDVPALGLGATLIGGVGEQTLDAIAKAISDEHGWSTATARGILRHALDVDDFRTLDPESVA